MSKLKWLIRIPLTSAKPVWLGCTYAGDQEKNICTCKSMHFYTGAKIKALSAHILGD